jgi:putative ABC transport system permease protein
MSAGPLRVVGHGLSDLRAHPGRAVLSGLSLCIGVLSVVAIFTIGAVTEEVFVAIEEQRTGRLVTVTALLDLGGAGPDRLRAALAAAEPVTATGGAAALVAHPPGLAGAGTSADVARGLPLEVQPVTLVAGDLAGVRRLPLLDGELFDSTSDLPVALVLNLPAARR